MSTPPEGLHPHVPTLLARIQACIDQVVGFLLVIATDGENPFPASANGHVSRVCRILQEQLDGLHSHLTPATAQDYVEASSWLLTELREKRGDGSLPSTGTSPSPTGGSSSKRPSSGERARHKRGST